MPEERESKTFVLATEAIGLLITAALVLLIGGSVQLVLRLLSWGSLHPDLGQMAYLFVFFILSLFLTVGTRDRPDYAPFVLYNVLLHGGFVLAGVLLFEPRLPGVWLGCAISCWSLLYVARFGFALLRRRAVGALMGPQVQGAPVLVQRCFFVRTPVHHALLIGLMLGTLYGALLRHTGTALSWHVVSGVFAALALVELRGLSAGFRLLRGDPAAASEGPAVVLSVDTSFDRGQLHVSAPAGVLLRVVSDVRRIYFMGQLERLMVLALCTLVVWWLELRSLPAGLIGGALLAAGLLTAPLPYVLGQRESRAQLGTASPDSPAMVPRLGSWLGVGCALLLGALAFLCLTPLLADAHGAGPAAQRAAG